MARYKSGWAKFWSAIGVIFLVLLVIGAILTILNYTIPEVQEFFVKVLDWFKSVFKISTNACVLTINSFRR